MKVRDSKRQEVFFFFSEFFSQKFLNIFSIRMKHVVWHAMTMPNISIATCHLRTIFTSVIILQLHGAWQSKDIWCTCDWFWFQNAVWEQTPTLCFFSNNEIKREKVCCDSNFSLRQNILFEKVHASYFDCSTQFDSTLQITHYWATTWQFTRLEMVEKFFYLFWLTKCFISPFELAHYFTATHHWTQTSIWEILMLHNAI